MDKAKANELRSLLEANECLLVLNRLKDYAETISDKNFRKRCSNIKSNWNSFKTDVGDNILIGELKYQRQNVIRLSIFDLIDSAEDFSQAPPHRNKPLFNISQLISTYSIIAILIIIFFSFIIDHNYFNATISIKDKSQPLDILKKYIKISNNHKLIDIKPFFADVVDKYYSAYNLPKSKVLEDIKAYWQSCPNDSTILIEEEQIITDINGKYSPLITFTVLYAKDKNKNNFQTCIMKIGINNENKISLIESYKQEKRYQPKTQIVN